MAKYVFSGSRHWKDEETIARILAKHVPEGSVVAHGNARGVDEIVDRVANRGLYTVIRFHADWDKHKKAAGPIRNREMLEVRPEMCICIHENISGSRGTKDMLTECRRRGIPVVLYGRESI